MNLSREEAGRHKTSSLHGASESPLHHQHESFMAYSSLTLAKKESQRGRNKWKIAPCVWHLLPNNSQLRTAWSWPRVNVSIRQNEKVSLNARANKLELSFPSVTGYPFPVCSWHCCHDDFLYLLCTKAPAVDGKLLRYQAQWKWPDVQWCGLLFFILHYTGSLNLLLLLTDRPTARTIALPFGAKFVSSWKVQTHQDTYRDE